MIEAWSAEDPWPGGTDRVLIVGPPGTGKTTKVLSSYVLPALAAGQRVLACSFSRAAAGELRSRVAAQIGGSPESWREVLTTIHSEASRRCKHLGLELRSDKKADDNGGGEEGEWAAHLAEIESRSSRDAMAAWDYVRNVWPEDRGMSPMERLARVMRGDKLAEASATVQVDQHRRYVDGRLIRPDFTALLELAIDQGDDRSLDLLAVDESQDLSALQWALVDTWAASAKRVLVVGDPDQAIYGWAGADGRRLLRWIRDGLPARRLAQSYRVPELPHALARRVVVQVYDREDAPYMPAGRAGSVEETDATAAWLEAGQVQAKGRRVLVLSRTKAGCADAADGLTEEGVAHITERGPCLLRRDGAAVRVASALADLCWSSRGAEKADAKKLISSLAANGPLLAGLRGRKKALLDLVAATNDGARVMPAALVGAGLAVAELERQWGDPDLEWWCSALLPSGVAVPDLLAVRSWLAEYDGVEKLFKAADLVRVTTAHGSKGREADLVVLDARRVAFLGERKGGRPEVRTLSQRTDEDLRLLYVAITRTMDRLLIIRGQNGEDWLDMHRIRVHG